MSDLNASGLKTADFVASTNARNVGLAGVLDKAGRATLESSDFFSQLLNVLPAAIYVTDAQGYVSGFGTRVIQTMIQQSGGEVKFEWSSGGLVCEILLPRSTSA